VVVTSGLICPDLRQAGDTPGIARQIEGALVALADVLDRSGSDLAHVLRLEAFLARAEDFALWNEAFTAAWPAEKPARTTLVSGFALPSVLIELQAIAAMR
jgi:2-iminobutanoate/2-iminopropanoate deaminase